MPEDRLHVSFWTEKAWTTEDIITLTGSVGEIYDALLAVRIRDRLVERQRVQRERYWEEVLSSWERFMDHPIIYEWVRGWRRAIQQGLPPFVPPPFPLPIQPPWSSYYQLQIPTGSDILQSIRSYAEEEDRCRLHAAKFSSPGGFSFTGLGEIVREFRELIKDIWYRNRQEKQLGRLEIIERFLRITREYSNNVAAPPPVAPVASERILLEIVDSAVRRIEGMERDGKLLPVPDNMDRIPL